MLLSGRSAERILIGDGPSIGGGGSPASDIGLATQSLAQLHYSWGLGDAIAYLGNRAQVAEAVRLDPRLREPVESDLKRLQNRADDVIDAHREAVAAIAEALRDRRYLGGTELRDIFERHRPRDAGARKDSQC